MSYRMKLETELRDIRAVLEDPLAFARAKGLHGDETSLRRQARALAEGYTRNAALFADLVINEAAANAKAEAEYNQPGIELTGETASPETFLLMEQLAKEYGCIVQLGRGPYGWNCTIMDPDVDGLNVCRFPNPNEAVQAAVERWREKKLARFPHLRAEGITIP